MKSAQYILSQLTFRSLLLAFLLVTGACRHTDTDLTLPEDAPAIERTPSGLMKVELEIGSDQFDGLIDTPRALTPEEECTIKTLNILAFSLEGNPGYEDEKLFHLPEIIAGPTRNGSKYTLTLLTKPGRQRLVLLANIPSAQPAYSIAGVELGMTKKQVYDRLVFPFSSDGWMAKKDSEIFDPIPMWGESNVCSVENRATPFGDYLDPQGTTGTIRLYRSLARIDFGLNFDDPTPGATTLPETYHYVPGDPFTFEAVYLYHPASSFRMAGDMRKIQRGTFTFTAPTLPTSLDFHTTMEEGRMPKWGTYNPQNLQPYEHVGRHIRAIYIPESPVPASLVERTCLVMKGKYRDQDPSYYALDISTTVNGQRNFLPLIRNKRYRINVKKITRSGYPTIEKAIKEEPSKTEIVYKLESLTPLYYRDGKGQERTLAVTGTVSTKVDGRVVSTRPLTLGDFDLEKVPSMDWLAVSGPKVKQTRKIGVPETLEKPGLSLRGKADPTQSFPVPVIVKRSLEDNPLAYMAKYNVTRDKKWDTNHTIPSTLEEAKKVLMRNTFARSTFKQPQSIEGSSEQYKIPGSYQMWSIIPSGLIMLSGREGLDNPVICKGKEKVQIAGQDFNASSTLIFPKKIKLADKQTGRSCWVALRYNGNDSTEKKYRSAWLYYWGVKEVNGRQVNGLYIHCINIVGISRSVTSAEDLLDKSFWDTYLSQAVVRFLPATGQSSHDKYDNPTNLTHQGEDGTLLQDPILSHSGYASFSENTIIGGIMTITMPQIGPSPDPDTFDLHALRLISDRALDEDGDE